MTLRSHPALVALAMSLPACHRHAVNDDIVQPPPRIETGRAEQKIVDPAIAALFRDTLPATRYIGEGKTYRVQDSTQRLTLQRVVAAERALWNASKPADYRFLTRSECFCPGPMRWLLLEVRHDRPVRVWDATGRRIETTASELNLDRLFDSLARVDNALSEVQIGFDEQWHYPRFLRTSMIYPDGWSIVVVRGFHPL